MASETTLRNIVTAAAAGAAGTLAIHLVHSANQKWLPQTMPPQREEPGHYIVHKAEDALPAPARESVTEKMEHAAAAALSFGYGSTWPALYAAVREEPNVWLDGAALGVGVWAIGYLGWLPSLGLMPPVRKHTATQVVNSIAQHALYGILTVSAWKKLRSILS